MISDDAILDFYDPYVDYWDEMKIRKTKFKLFPKI